MPLGDSFRASVVRTVMRVAFALQGKSSRQVIAKTQAEGISLIAQCGRLGVPERDVIEGDLQSLSRALGRPV